MHRRVILTASIVALAAGLVGCARRDGPEETSSAVPVTGAATRSRSSTVGSLPVTVGMPFIRADFADPAAWERVTGLVSIPDEQGYPANLERVEDRTLAGLDETALAARFPKLYPEKYDHPVVFVADAVALSDPEHPILVVNLNKRDDSRPFRAVPGEIASIEANLAISTMDFRRRGGADRRASPRSRPSSRPALLAVLRPPQLTRGPLPGFDPLLGLEDQRSFDAVLIGGLGHVHPAAPPFLLAHGSSDEIVPIAHSRGGPLVAGRRRTTRVGRPVRRQHRLGDGRHLRRRSSGLLPRPSVRPEAARGRRRR